MLTSKGANIALDATTDQVSHIALFSADTELVGGGYMRQSIEFNPANEGKTSNNTDILFPAATASWGIVSHIGLFDANNNELWHGALATPKTIDTDDQLKIGAGRLTVEIT